MAFQQLNEDDQRKLKAAYSNYLADGGFDGLLRYMGNRTVKEIFALSEQQVPAVPIEEGERDGVAYRLYEKPKCGDSSQNE